MWTGVLIQLAFGGHFWNCNWCLYKKIVNHSKRYDKQGLHVHIHHHETIKVQFRLGGRVFVFDGADGSDDNLSKQNAIDLIYTRPKKI